ncbi:1-phosphofructokinase [Caldinitratiruptor microaerophilus]|uniref:Tagatose-6-phosphate kinase n=1 Tax=Caldinitratiruptor microaerophilus TaxID=671077 RepID=A0AA35CJ92_9FIRM|nr:1-phosphofructokinase [Caldinitratiruptor microaerophilus]BDG59484.1 tagatose-6-phosphate kinase [Caldinitratiruptor microaerophilus]
MAKAVATVTLNPALDRTVEVEGLRLGGTNRVAAVRVDPGGKGLNVARVARRLGLEAIALGLLGEENSHLFHRVLAWEGVEDRLIEVPGETRTNLKIVDRLSGLETEINEVGFTVTPEHLERLREVLEQVLDRTGALVVTGSLPPGAPADTYARHIRLARAAGVLTVLDASGDALRQGLRAAPDAVKPNRAELEEAAGRPLSDLGAVYRAASDLLTSGPGWVLVSLGAEGAVLVTPEGAWRGTVPDVPIRSTVGAGDSMVAALVHGLLHGMDPPGILRRALAAGVATATLPGTELCTAEAVDEMARAITVHPCEPERVGEDD